jgi:hypothetical protein
MDEVGRFFARFDPFGHKKHRAHAEPCDDDENGKHEEPELIRKPKPFPHPYFPFPWWGKPASSTRAQPAVGDSTLLRANDTTMMVNATDMASTTTSTTTPNTTTSIPTVTDAQLQGRRLRRHLLRGSTIDADATPMTAGEDGPPPTTAHGPAGQRLARTEEVEMLRHEQVWALPGQKEKAKPKVVGEAYEHITSHSVVFLEPDAIVGAGGHHHEQHEHDEYDKHHEHHEPRHQHVHTMAASESDEMASMEADDYAAADHERRRQLLLHHHWHGGRADVLDDYDDYDDYEEEDEGHPSYYSKDGGDWYWQTHARGGFRGLQEFGEDEMGGDGHGQGDPAALLIDADSPENAVPSQHRPTPAQVRDMTPEEQAALQARDREALENMLRKASREENAHRPEPHVATSLNSVLEALAVRPPAPADRVGRDDDGDDFPRARRGLQAGAGAGGAGAGGAGAQRAAAVVSAVAASVTEQQKAEIRQAVYNAAVALVREAAREAMQEAGYGDGGGGSSSMGNSNNNKARANAVGRGGAFGTGGNEDAYQAAANAILNVLSRNEPGPSAVRAAVLDNVEERAATAGASRASESRGRAIDTGRGKSLLEAARQAARQSASAGRPPAEYDPYPPHRHQRGRRRLRGLKDATFRVPVPFTRDPASNATNPKLVYNASDAVYINLSAREDEDGALQITAQRMRSDGGNERQIPWPRIGGVGPALGGLGASQQGSSGGNSDDNPKEGGKKGKHAWADALLDMVHRHRHQPSSHYHTSRALEATAAAPSSTPPETAPATTEPATQPTTVGDDSLQNTNDNKDGNAAAGGGGGGGGGGLDLNALAGLFQRPLVPAVPGSIGADYNDPKQQQQGQVDAFGNSVEPPAKALGQQGPSSMMAEQHEDGQEDHEEEEDYEEEEEEEDEAATGPEPMGMGDAFYDRATSQLLSHSGSNFKKMQAIVNQIMADEGFDV